MHLNIYYQTTTKKCHETSNYLHFKPKVLCILKKLSYLASDISQLDGYAISSAIIARNITTPPSLFNYKCYCTNSEDKKDCTKQNHVLIYISRMETQHAFDTPLAPPFANNFENNNREA